MIEYTVVEIESGITGVYKRTEYSYIWIPADAENSDYQEYLLWLEEQQTPPA